MTAEVTNSATSRGSRTQLRKCKQRASHTVSHFYSCQEGPREIGRRLYSHDRSMPTNTAVFGGQFVLPSRGARGTRLPWPLLEAVPPARLGPPISSPHTPAAAARRCAAVAVQAAVAAAAAWPTRLELPVSNGICFVAVW